MLKSRDTGQFKKDLKKVKKQGKDLSKLRLVVTQIVNENSLPTKYKDHALKGRWSGSRDCHVENDLVLICTIDKEQKNVTFERLGSHSELFG